MKIKLASKSTFFYYGFLLFELMQFISLSKFRIKIDRPTLEEYLIDNEDTRIQISGSTILLALAVLTRNLGMEPQFQEKPHSVYRIDQKTSVKRKEASKTLSPLFTTFAAPVKEDDIFSYPSKIQHICFLVMADDTPESLCSKNVGGSFPRSVDVSTSLLRTAIATITENIRKTLSTVARKTYGGPLSPFIQLLGCKSSDDPEKATELLGSISLIEQFIAKLTQDSCNFVNVSTLLGFKALIEEAMKTCASIDWKNFLASKANTAFDNNNLASTVVSPPQSVFKDPLDTLWSFLENRECHVYLGSNVCVDLKSFSTTSIRNVILVLQSQYKTFPKKTRFLVGRFSNAIGSVEKGKDLVGQFEMQQIDAQMPAAADDSSGWSSATYKLSHTYFVIVDQESPPEEDA